MNALTVTGLTKSFGARTLFEDISFSAAIKGHTGLIGGNGSGKTTLFSLISGSVQADSGQAVWASQVRLGFLEQFSRFDPDRSLYDETLSVFHELAALEQALHDIHHAIDKANGDELEPLIARQHAMQESFQDRGGLTYPARTRAALLGMGFSETDFLLPMQALSGGQHSKAQMAKLLLSEADFLLLDEPTNHLDIAACEWMESFLSNYSGGFIVISHDRFFLDRVTNHTLELAHGKIFSFRGNYSAYQLHKTAQREQAIKTYKNMQKEVKRLEEMITEMRRWNREKSIKAAESKQKVLDKLKAEMQKPTPDPKSMALEFKPKRRSGNDVMDARDLSKSFDAPLFKDVNIELFYGERAFLIGPNGCGKTTLFRVLTDQIPADTGEVRFGAHVRVGFYDQSHSDLNPEHTALEAVWSANARMAESRVRNALAAFLFQGDDVYKKIASLSGGERARISLLKLMLQGANFLMMDEPTNHLDLNAREALEQALLGYEGTFLIISHDRYLINRLAGKVYAMRPDGLSMTLGNYDDYLNTRQTGEAPTDEKQVKQPNAYQLQKSRNAELRKLKKSIENTEQRIHEIEGELETLSAKLSEPETAADYQSAMELTEKQAQLMEELEENMLSWEQSHDALAEYETI